MRYAVGFLSALAVFAFASVTPAHAAPASEAGTYVESLGNKAITLIKNTALPKDKKQKQLEQLFSDNVDVPWVGRFVMGRYWRDASEEQKAHYLKEYEAFLVQNYAVRFTDYTSGNFKITGTKDDGDGEFAVSMEITSGEAGSEPVLVDYRVREAGKGKYKVFDIIVEGVSMITTQRSEFSSVIADKGIDHLIGQLASRSIPVDTSNVTKK